MLKIINHGNVREIRLARPPVNAINLEFAKLLTEPLREAVAECSAVVISGQQGGRPRALQTGVCQSHG